MQIDKEAGNDYWERAINKEMSKLNVAWKRVDVVTPEQSRLGSVKELIECQDINCNIIFDSLKGFPQKARFFTGGHTTESQNSINHSSLLYYDSICIGFLLASLHVIDITDIDMDNDHLNAPCAEKIWFVCGNEYREDKCRVLLIIHALYGLRYADVLWRSVLAAAFQEIGLDPTLANPFL